MMHVDEGGKVGLASKARIERLRENATGSGRNDHARHVARRAVESPDLHSGLTRRLCKSASLEVVQAPLV
jgi:hypothetical protein